MFTHKQIWGGVDLLADNLGYTPSGLARKAGLGATSFNNSKRMSPEGKPSRSSTESIAKILKATNTSLTEFVWIIEAPNLHD